MQEQFCQEYAIGKKAGNGTQAAIRAGYSEDTAQEQSSRLLSIVMVSARVEELKQARLARMQITGDRIMARLAELAFGSLKNCVDPETGHLIPLHELPAEAASAIREVTHTTVKVRGDENSDELVTDIKYKISDPKPSLELLMKEAGMLTDRLQVEGKVKAVGFAIGRNKQQPSDG